MIDELRKLNETWMRAWFEKDAAAVDRMTADDYVYVAPSGRVMDRQEILAIIRSPGYALDHGAAPRSSSASSGQLRPGQASVAGRREF